MTKRSVVHISKFAEKQIKRLPKFIKEAVNIWAHSVEEDGIRETRKLPGYHDEPLRGDRKGQRSIRLNKQWRAIYRIINKKIEFVLIEEVTPHDY